MHQARGAYVAEADRPADGLPFFRMIWATWSPRIVKGLFPTVLLHLVQGSLVWNDRRPAQSGGSFVACAREGAQQSCYTLPVGAAGSG